MLTVYAKRFDIEGFMDVLKKANHEYQQLPLMQAIKEKEEYPYRVLIGTLLSSRTKDELTAVISKRLFQKASNPEKLAQLSEQEIMKIIYPVGFYRRKAKNLKAIASLLVEKFHYIVPDSLEELLQFPGVGRKTANLVLGTAFNINAICVDTHVHRISNRLGIVKTKIPAETEQDLKKMFPEKYWIPLNPYLVSHGQAICKPISPICSKCKIHSFCQRIGVDRSR